MTVESSPLVSLALCYICFILLMTYFVLPWLHFYRYTAHIHVTYTSTMQQALWLAGLQNSCLWLAGLQNLRFWLVAEWNSGTHLSHWVEDRVNVIKVLSTCIFREQNCCKRSLCACFLGNVCCCLRGDVIKSRDRVTWVPQWHLVCYQRLLGCYCVHCVGYHVI